MNPLQEYLFNRENIKRYVTQFKDMFDLMAEEYDESLKKARKVTGSKKWQEDNIDFLKSVIPHFSENHKTVLKVDRLWVVASCGTCKTSLRLDIKLPLTPCDITAEVLQSDEWKKNADEAFLQEMQYFFWRPRPRLATQFVTPSSQWLLEEDEDFVLWHKS